MSEQIEQAVADYYDSNTRRFLALGGSGDVAAIHRAIWAAGVGNRNQAFLYLNRLVADALRPLRQSAENDMQILDLGCGVGGTSTWLARELQVQVTGVTISATQCTLAQQRAQSLGLDRLTTFISADFCDSKAMNSLPVADAACAIESFAHVRDPERFFAMAAQRIKVGGRLVICDDFLVDCHDPRARYWQQRVRDGWHLHSLLPEQQVIDLAAAAGFRLLLRQDHSSDIRSLHPVLLALATNLTRLQLPWAYWHNLAGGSALQLCLCKGWTRYLSLVWERHDTPRS